MSIEGLFSYLPPGFDISNVAKWNFQDPATKKPAIYAINGILMGLSIFTVALRFYSRIMVVGKTSWSDKLIIPSLIFACGVSITCIMSAAKFNFGKHIYTVPLASLWNVGKFVECVYAIAMLYYFAIAFIKCSVLVFYWQLSPHIQFRRLTKIMIVYTIVCGLAFVAVDVFQCHPYDPSKWVYAKDAQGSCINVRSFYIAQCALNAFGDVVIYIMPIPMLWKMQLPRRQRIVVCCVLGLGLFVCISSIVRLALNIVEVHIESEVDPTWSLVTSTLFDGLEAHIAIICASIPPIKPLVMRIAPRILGRSSAKSSRYTASTEEQFTSDGGHGIREVRRKAWTFGTSGYGKGSNFDTVNSMESGRIESKCDGTIMTARQIEVATMTPREVEVAALRASNRWEDDDFDDAEIISPRLHEFNDLEKIYAMNSRT